MRIVVGDIGGTHARFALAELAHDALPRLGEMRRYRTRDYSGLAEAWAQFRNDVAEPLPGAAALALATPMDGDVLRFTNSAWVVDPSSIQGDLSLSNLLLLNDFGAVAHAVSALPPGQLRHLAGPAADRLPEVTTIAGLGTGLGVAILLRRGGAAEVIETEAAHIGFVPGTETEEALASVMRQRHGRCSVERVVAGPGLSEIHALLRGDQRGEADPSALWSAAIDGSDPLASSALDILIGCFGAAAGDLVLAQGSQALVVTGGLANRMPDRIASPTFHDRFVAKGRYRARMERIPILLATEAEPGLHGAAIAYQRAFSGSTG